MTLAATSTEAHRAPMEPWIPSQDVESFCELFEESPVKSDKNPFTYETWDDFGRVIKKLLVSIPKEGMNRCFFENILEIGQIEGFKVKCSRVRNFYPVRDAKLPFAVGHTLAPTCSEKANVAIERLKLRIHHLQNHSAALSDHPKIQNVVFGQVARYKLYENTQDRLLTGSSLYQSNLYFEGGNCFCLKDRNGRSHFIIGEDSLTVTHLVLRQEKWFVPHEAPIQVIARRISSNKSNSDILSVLHEMKAIGLLTVVQFDTEVNKTRGRQIATTYLAQREAVEKQIFPTELRCGADNIVYLAQGAAYLDQFIAPGPKGSVFMQDYTLTYNILLLIRLKAKALKLTFEDSLELQSFIQATLKICLQLTPLLNRVKGQLSDAGFTVIPTPGAFFGCKATEVRSLNINFFNCLTGFSPKTKHYYYITSGAKTTGILGKVLMDIFATFLKFHCNNIVVYFVGRKPDNSEDFSEAMGEVTINGKKTYSFMGPHSKSYEIEIAPYTEMEEESKKETREEKC